MFYHCMRSIQIRSFFFSIFSRIRTSYLSVFSPNAGKYGPEKTPDLGTSHAVYVFYFLIHHVLDGMVGMFEYLVVESLKLRFDSNIAVFYWYVIV